MTDLVGARLMGNEVVERVPEGSKMRENKGKQKDHGARRQQCQDQELSWPELCLGRWPKGFRNGRFRPAPTL